MWVVFFHFCNQFINRILIITLTHVIIKNCHHCFDVHVIQDLLNHVVLECIAVDDFVVVHVSVKIVFDERHRSASKTHCGVKELRNHGIIGDLITITLNARINLICHIFLVDVTLGLSCTDESYNFEHETVVNSSVGKLDGVEVNNHVAVFGGELHEKRGVPLTLLIWHGSDRNARGSGQFAHWHTAAFSYALIVPLHACHD